MINGEEKEKVTLFWNVLLDALDDYGAECSLGDFSDPKVVEESKNTVIRIIEEKVSRD